MTSLAQESHSHAHPQTDPLLVRSAWLSVIVSLVVLAVKFYGYHVTNSESVLSDAMESVVNVVTSIVALLVMRAAAEPADDEHPYGHGKLEFFSAAFEGGFVIFGGLAILYAAGEAILKGSHFDSLIPGIIALCVATLINGGLAWHLFRVARRYQTEALLASAKHIWADVVTTVAVIVGLGFTHFLNWPWLDNAIAVAVGLHILAEGAKIVRRSAGALIDETDQSVMERLAQAFRKNKTTGVIDIHKVKIIRSGRFHHIDAHLVVPEFWSVAQAHLQTHDFEQGVLRDYLFSGEIAFHLDPCRKEYCRSCALSECPIRVEIFERAREFSGEQLIRAGISDSDLFAVGPKS